MIVLEATEGALSWIDATSVGSYVAAIVFKQGNDGSVCLQILKLDPLGSLMEASDEIILSDAIGAGAIFAGEGMTAQVLNREEISQVDSDGLTTIQHNDYAVSGICRMEPKLTIDALKQHELACPHWRFESANQSDSRLILTTLCDPAVTVDDQPESKVALGTFDASGDVEWQSTGIEASNVSKPVVINNEIYLLAESACRKIELWKIGSDGTEELLESLSVSNKRYCEFDKPELVCLGDEILGFWRAYDGRSEDLAEIRYIRYDLRSKEHESGMVIYEFGITPSGWNITEHDDSLLLSWADTRGYGNGDINYVQFKTFDELFEEPKTIAMPYPELIVSTPDTLLGLSFSQTIIDYKWTLSADVIPLP